MSAATGRAKGHRSAPSPGQGARKGRLDRAADALSTQRHPRAGAMGAVRGLLASLASRSQDRKAPGLSSPRASSSRSAGPRSAGPRAAGARTAGAARSSAARSSSAGASAVRASGRRSGASPRGGAGRAAVNGGGVPRGPRGARGQRPVPPPQPRYWLRRLSLLGAVVLLLLALVVGIVQAAYAVRDQIREQDRQQAAERTVTPYPAPRACAADALGVSVRAPEEVAPGAGMSVEVTATNNGADACLLDLGGQSLGARITSGGNPVWASDTCSPSAGSRLLLVKPGASASATITWDGRRSGSKCVPAAPTATATGTMATPTTTASESPSATPSQDPAVDPSASQGAAPSASADPAATPTPSASPLAPAQSDGDVATTGVYKLQLRLGDANLGDERVFVVK
ncbi:hypothetical protein [Actinomyces sp. zg296]|uniref:hypothetical protein n=1 Tax=Actinomyces sp. zg296 TaxID=2609289 RepID=UPI00135A0D93|nr:hypothetical protein [Actinomyces sp. zg296]